MFLKWILRLVIAGVVIFGVIQFIPKPAAMANPPVLQEPNWDSPETRAIAERACFDCHSNETKWPWYAHVQPVSLLLGYDIAKGREMMNFSEWGTDTIITGDFAERTIRNGKMPLGRYLMLHPEAKLTSEEQDQLIAGLKLILD